MKTIATLTLNPAIDGAAEAGLIRPIHKIRMSNERYDPGGGGINVARVVRELDGDVYPIYLACPLVRLSLRQNGRPAWK